MDGYVEHICRFHYSALMNLPNVVGVGLGYKMVGGMQTNTLCVAVLVSEKVAAKKLDEHELVPSIYMNVVTDVVKVGEITASSLKGKVTPVIQGYSIGIETEDYIYTQGSAGCVVYDKEYPEIHYILSSNHVLANDNMAFTGTTVLQPAKEDEPEEAAPIGTLARFVPIYFRTANEVPTNYVDCALVQLVSNDIATTIIHLIGSPTGTTTPTLGMNVAKSARTSGYTNGIIQYMYTTLLVNYGGGRSAVFTDQIVTTSMSNPGDSGAVLIEPNMNKVIGLLMASSNEASIYNPIGDVLLALNVGLVTENVEYSG